jgi:hypothetical protein
MTTTTTTAPKSLGPKDTAAMIRKVLRATFPATKFSVTTGRGSGVSSVDVRWTDGPTAARVNEFVACFQAGHFDGMTDMYEYDRAHFVEIDGEIYRPATRYVQTSRESSPRALARATSAVASYWMTTAEERATIAAAIADLEAGNVNDFWNNVRRLRLTAAPSRDFCELVYRALGDRTTCTLEVAA